MVAVPKLALAGLVMHVALGRIGATAAQGPIFRAGVDVVHIGLTVTDRTGALVADLTPDQIELYEDGVRQTIRYFASGGEGGASPPLHVGLLLDVSESMERDIEFTRTASIRFLRALPDPEDVTVVDFDAEVRTARFAPSDFPRLVERIRQQEVEGMTALYDAIGVYLEGAAAQEGRKVMLLYSDGGDTRSALRFRDVLDMLEASDVTIFVIGALNHQPASGRLQARMALTRIAEATGGQAFFVSDAEQLDRIYAQIASEIRGQYIVGYVSSNTTADGGWREVSVRLAARPDGGDLRVRSRKGYYAPYRVR